MPDIVVLDEFLRPRVSDREHERVVGHESRDECVEEAVHHREIGDVGVLVHRQQQVVPDFVYFVRCHRCSILSVHFQKAGVRET